MGNNYDPQTRDHITVPGNTIPLAHTPQQRYTETYTQPRRRRQQQDVAAPAIQPVATAPRAHRPPRGARATTTNTTIHPALRGGLQPSNQPLHDGNLPRNHHYHRHHNRHSHHIANANGNLTKTKLMPQQETNAISFHKKPNATTQPSLHYVASSDYHTPGTAKPSSLPLLQFQKPATVGYTTCRLQPAYGAPGSKPTKH